MEHIFITEVPPNNLKGKNVQAKQSSKAWERKFTLRRVLPTPAPLFSFSQFILPATIATFWSS